MPTGQHAARRSSGAKRGVSAVVTLLAALGVVFALFNLPDAGATTPKESDKNLQPYPHPKDQPLVKAQVPLLAVTDELHALVSGKGIEGFVGAAVEPENRALAVFWHGDVPGAVKHFLDKASGREGIDAIEVVQVPHSRATLLEESHRIAQENVDRVTTVGPTSDFSAIQVGFQPTEDGEVPAGAMEGIESEVELVPVPRARARALHGSRSDDVEPFWGGAVILDEAGTFCSTGFAARKAKSGQDVMIGAEHCDVGAPAEPSEPGSKWFTEESGRFVGQSTHRDRLLDTMLLTGADYQSASYIGPFDSNQGAPVQGASRNVLGAILCTSGGLSGEVCGNETIAVGQFQPVEGVVHGPMFTIENLNGIANSGGGDSGGPIYRPVPDAEHPDKWTLKAHGIISSGINNAPCQGRDFEGERACGTITSGIDMKSILDHFDLKLP